MADENDKAPEDKAAAAQGAGPADLDDGQTGGGNPAPAAPLNKAPENTDGDDKSGDDDNSGEDAGKSDDTGDDVGEAEDNNEDKPLDSEVWGSTGDEAGDAALALIQNAGISVEEAKALMFDAVKEGKPENIDRDALVEKVGKDKAALILAGVENFVTRSKAKAETILNEVHTTVGGKENWDAVTTWAKENVSAEDMADYRDMIDAGGAKARFAANELASRYNGDDGNTTLNTSEIKPDTKAAPKGEVLTKVQYFEKIEAAYAKGATEAEINEIKAARARGRAKGI